MGTGTVVYVVATTLEGTRAALEAATARARALSGRAVLLLGNPELRSVADACSPRPDVLSFVCDRPLDVLQLLHHSGQVVVGGGKRWGWPTAEERLAKSLSRAGYQVTFASPGSP